MAVLGLLFAAGCRSSQSAYQFQPPASSALAAAGSAAVAVPAPHISSPQHADKQKETAGRSLGQRPPLKRQPVRRQQLRRAVAQAVQQQRRQPRQMLAATQSVRHTSGPRQTSEVGLGTTVLGVLGLVVLPISLIGLLIWGGPVWIILAALSALAVLVAYLDPFG